jgi:carboxypeptidase family protein
MHKVQWMIPLLLIIALLACQSRKDGAIEGSVVPAGASASVTITHDGKDIRTIPVTAQDGSFRAAVAAGTYDVAVTTPGAAFPVRLEGIVVRPGETTKLSPIMVTPVAGASTLLGKVFPARPGLEVKLLYEGQERASVQTDKEGRYEFKEIPAGAYEVRAIAPGHAEDRAPVSVTGDRKAEHTAVLLPITSVEGVDWAGGKIRATGIGLPPPAAPNATVRKAMAERAALADGQRNLLRTIERIRIDDSRDIKTAMGNRNFAERIQGFVKGYTVASTRELDGGKIEIVLELPLTGPSGLSRHVMQ